MKKINKAENVLICKVKFNSSLEKDIFFQWISKVDCIDKSLIQSDQINLYIAADDIHDHDLDNLMGLFYRFDIEMTQLARFLTDHNKKWFYDNKMAFWHKKIFKKIKFN